jgi:hypothetical protein
MKNAFDQSVRYLFVRPNNNQTDTTVFPGRSVWVQLSWKR